MWLPSTPSTKGGPHPRVSSPEPLRSTLMTSAPRSASTCPAQGPARMRANSRTRRPARGFAMEFSLSFSCFARAAPAAAPLYLEARIEIVPQTVAEQIEGEHGEADRDTREEDHPGRLPVEVGGIAREHQPPGGGRLGHAEAEERQRGLRQDSLRDEGGQHDEVGR